MTLIIERANVGDVEELMKLYFLIYQNNYPLAICSDRDVMTMTLVDSNTYWYVTRDSKTHAIVGSAVFETDPLYCIGKLTGVVVHPGYRKREIASQMIARGTSELLLPLGPIRSIYTTTRTISRSPQIMCLKNGFLPLGIFPNAHKIQEYETLTLMAKYGNGVLESKPPFPPVPERIAPMLAIFQNSIHKNQPIEIVKDDDKGAAFRKNQEQLSFEFIRAPHYVLRRFNVHYTDPYERFFPFHKPNILMASTNGEVEIFGYINESDGHLAIVALNQAIYELGGRIRPLLHQLRSIGVSYIEVLIGMQFAESLSALTEAQFLPSAVYPAMYEVDGKVADFVVMSRTLEPLNFRGMHIEGGFKPYVDLYVKLWKDMYLETLEVFDEYES